MSQETRTDLKALIDLYITTNGNKDITGAQLNEILTNIIDSGFLQLDELRTALSTSYDPATPANWNATIPTEVKAALDQAISRVATVEDSISTNPSDNIAYVSDSGSDVIGEYEIGNPLKPFATFNSAINSLGNGGVIKALGGTYNQSIASIANKNGLLIILDGCTLNGTITVSGTSQNITISLVGGTINNTNDSTTLLIQGSNNFILEGGKVINTNTGTNSYNINGTGSNKLIKNTSFESQYRNTSNVNDSVFDTCKFNSLNTGLFQINNSTFYNCKIESTNGNGYNCSLTANTFYNCDIKGAAGITNQVNTLGYFYNCRIEGKTLEAVTIERAADELFFKDCDIIGNTDAITYSGNTQRAATTNNVFQNCKIYAGTGDVFNEPTYLGTDLGNAQVINCTYNKSFTPATVPQKIFEYNKVEIVGLQEPLK